MNKITSEVSKMDFKSFNNKLVSVFDKATKNRNVFLTKGSDPDDLWNVYLDSFLTEELRQEHNCNCCKNFIRNYGSMVTLDSKGKATSPLWDTGTDFGEWNDVVKVLSKQVKKQKVSGIMYTKENVLGESFSGGWSHFSVATPNNSKVSGHKTHSQLQSEKKEEYRMVSRSIIKYSLASVEQAISILTPDTLNQSDKFLGVVQWWNTLYNGIVEGSNRNNVIWNFVAESPSGFCHINGTVVGSLLDNIIAGKSFDEIKRIHNSMVDPLKYQRAQSAPTLGNINQAEKIIEQLGIEKSLYRRVASVAEIDKLWVKPDVKTSQESSGSVFGHLKKDIKGSKEINPIEVDGGKVTLEKFMNKIVGSADKVEAYIRTSEYFVSFVAPVHDDAPSIMKWDNNFSWYTYPQGSRSQQWGLKQNSYVEVLAIADKPCNWEDSNIKGVMGNEKLFVLKGCKDNNTKVGLGLFPSLLRNDLHSIRSTMEHYSNEGTLGTDVDNVAAGIVFGNNNQGLKIRVTSNKTVTLYEVDRLD